MGEVTRFFCCANNITGCMIIGGILAVLNAMVVFVGWRSGILNVKHLAELAKTSLVIYSLAILISLMLVLGAMKRNACMVKTWMFFNGLAILLYVIGSFFNGQWKNWVIAAVATWAELVAFGALKEIHDSSTSNLPNPVRTLSSVPAVHSYPPAQSGAPPTPQAQSGLPTYAQTQFGAPPPPAYLGQWFYH